MCMHISGMPAWPKTMTYSDQKYAAEVPIVISVSMVQEPCLIFVHVALWNGAPPLMERIVAKMALSDCQQSNCSAGIIDTGMMGWIRAPDILIQRLRWIAPASQAMKA